MDKRVLTTVGISMAILYVWTKWFMPPPPTHPTTPATQQQQAAGASPSPSASPAPGAPGATASPDGTTPSAAPKAERAPEQLVKHQEPGLFETTMSTWGAAPTSWRLLEERFKPGELIQGAPPRKPLLISLTGIGPELTEDAAWNVVEKPDGLTFVWESPDVKVTKRFQFVPKTYQVDLTVLVENKSDKPLTPRLLLAMNGWQDPNVKPGGMFTRRVSQNEGQCDVAGKLKKAGIEALLKKPIQETGQVRWVGIGEQYFVYAVAAASGATEERRCDVTAGADGSLRATMLFAERKLAPGETASYPMTTFFGPKVLSKLDDVKLPGTSGTGDAGLGSALDYGWTEIIARPMLAVLKAIHVVVPNWGLCIILLTLLIKIITFWPTQKSMQSMRSMAKLKPEMDKLQKQYADDKPRLNQEVMALYKKHGVNPVGGCLPMLIQMPIYIALYSMLGNSVELYRSAFFFQIQDLTAPDPYYIMPILTGGLMFAQQRLSPTPPDDSQKMMMYMMPVMFTAFSILLPAGLTIYILTNTLLTMAQQYWMNRKEPKPVRTAPST